MSFQPVVPIGGYGGWKFLQRTIETQKAAFQAAGTQQRDEDYFRQKIGQIDTAEQLVSDRRLLRVALGAFGLDTDINNRFFIRKVLEDGTLSTDALSSKLSNKQYAKFSAAFGFGDYSIPRTKLSDFAEKTIAMFNERQFESAVGEQDNNLRLAMNAQRELTSLAAKTGSEDTLWYAVMGNAPLRTVFEKALGLPSSFAAIDLDQQLATLKDKAARKFGSSSIRQFSDPAQTEKLIRDFLIRSEASADSATFSRGATALAILQGGSA